SEEVLATRGCRPRAACAPACHGRPGTSTSPRSAEHTPRRRRRGRVVVSGTMGGQVPARPECRVVEIGRALRTARERQGLELGEVERETRIRARFLAALEEERFEVLPARAYAKGFLRVYADFLGLDGRLIVEEFNARLPEAEPLELAPPAVSEALADAWIRRRPVLLVSGLA